MESVPELSDVEPVSIPVSVSGVVSVVDGGISVDEGDGVNRLRTVDAHGSDSLFV